MCFNPPFVDLTQTINAKNYVEAESMLDDGTPYTNAVNALADAMMKFKSEAVVIDQ
jgi:methylase of polypeptide subunit release factors